MAILAPRTIDDSLSHKLCGWDFDQTLVLIHAHNALQVYFGTLKKSDEGVHFCEEYESSHGEAPSNQVLLEFFSDKVLAHYKENLLKVENLRNAKDTAERIIELAQRGAHQAVVSFTWFPQIVKPTIQFILENHFAVDGEISDANRDLIDSIVENFLVVGGFPQDTIDKDPVIGHSMPSIEFGKLAHLRVAQQHFKILDNECVCLVDDSLDNIQSAARKGYETYHAKVPGAHESESPINYLYEMHAFLRSEEENLSRMALTGGAFLNIEELNSDDDEFDFDGATVAASETSQSDAQPQVTFRSEISAAASDTAAVSALELEADLERRFSLRRSFS